MNEKKRLPYFVFSLFLLLCPLFLSLSQAAEITLTPSVGLRTEYDDNIDFDHNNIKRDDFIFTVSPGLRLDYKTERTYLGATAKVNVLRYADYSDEDTVNQYYGVNASHKLTEKFAIRANAGYNRDTTQDTYLDESGIVTKKSTVHRYSGGAGLSYSLNEVSDLALNYSHSATDYTNQYDEDTTNDSVSLTYSHAFLDRRFILSVSPYYGRYDSDTSTVDNYGLSLGMSHRFWETLVVNAMVGARYSDTQYHLSKYHLQDSTDTNWNWTANISATKSWETASATVGYTRDLYYNSDGEPVNVDRFSASASRKFTDKFGANVSGTLYFTKSDNSDNRANEEDSRYYSVSPSLYYTFTKDHRLDVGYTYANDYDKTLDRYETIERNRFWILLTFNFPYTW
ncbi:uncharacterized protein, PEP-CTERM system associated [Syntrophus gentianae]|uniref:Uncharacterized protein, PEP-CTERM system associated n=1 Tax=Syntrophus gentianae TaxID=43775 RepID=A0A1H7Y9J8_9BACT|nr:outer membrane beta-barrel protein [Syntrophus gentianae]SEM42832.1 uncharacterized protein, PEP-CTERM system associated [Syntrophus gentianae]